MCECERFFVRYKVTKFCGIFFFFLIESKSSGIESFFGFKQPAQTTIRTREQRFFPIFYFRIIRKLIGQAVDSLVDCPIHVSNSIHSITGIESVRLFSVCFISMCRGEKKK